MILLKEYMLLNYSSDISGLAKLISLLGQYQITTP